MTYYEKENFYDRFDPQKDISDASLGKLLGIHWKLHGRDVPTYCLTYYDPVPADMLPNDNIDLPVV